MPPTPKWSVWIQVLWVSLLLSLGCGAQEAPGEARSLQDSCEAILASRIPSEIQLRPADSGVVRWSFRPAELPTRIHGVSWNPSRERVAILDRGAGHLLEFDLRGGVVQKLFRFGNGPGEWSPDEYMTNQRPQLLGGTTGGWLLLGVQGISLYDPRGVWRSTIPMTGRARWRMEQVMAAAVDSVHVAISHPGAAKSPRAPAGLGATRSRIVSYDVRTGDSTLIGVVDNPVRYTGVDPQSGEPRTVVYLNPPFLDAFRRTWTTQEGWLGVISYSTFGVCMVRLADRKMFGYRLAAARPAIDAAEKDWALRLGVRDPDGKLPMIHVSVREAFEDHWPAEEPFYLDLVAGDSGEVSALRRTPDHQFAIDRYSPLGGYLGSRLVVRPYAFPRAVGGGVEVMLREDEGGWVIEGRSRKHP